MVLVTPELHFFSRVATHQCGYSGVMGPFVGPGEAGGTPMWVCAGQENRAKADGLTLRS